METISAKNDTRGNVVLVIHVGENQMHYLLDVLGKNDWTWSHFVWEKESSSFKTNKLTYEHESWFACWDKKICAPLQVAALDDCNR
mgnify:CR=1 FL=1